MKMMLNVPYVGCCIEMMNQGIHGYVVINVMSGSALNAQD